MKFLFLIIILFIINGNLYSQIADNKKEQPKETKYIPDEFSDLDEVPIPKTTKDERVLKVLEQARQKYLQALILIGRKDTANALSYFEQSLKSLNTLINYPDIDKNIDFKILSKRIIDDYESNLTELNKSNENSSIFIIRDKFLKDNEITKPTQGTTVESIKIIKKDSLASTSLFKNDNIIPLMDNEFVQKSIDFLTQNKIGKKFIRNCIERYGKWGPMLNNIISEEGMPPEIIFLSMVESGLNPMAVSRAKAVGLWQFIRKTGKDYGLNDNNSCWIDERKDPEKSTRASMRHLKDLFKDFNDWYLAMAAYNYGAGGVKKSIQKSKMENPNFWDLRDYLPKETKNYIPLFIATAKVVMNPKDYGLDLSEFSINDEFRFDTFVINEPISLKALAKCANITVDEFREYNPELVLSCTPPDLKEYEIRIPEGSKSTFITQFATLTPEEKKPWVTHVTGKKETFESIASIYGITGEELASANNMSYSKKRIKKGISLRVPTESIIPPEEVVKRINDKNNNVTKNDSFNNDFITHKVSTGESLDSIANQYGVSVAELKNLNNITSDSVAPEPGTLLKITTRNAYLSNQKSQNQKRPDIIRHTVKESETLESIADHYKVATDDIRRWNRLEYGIRLGQNLKIITTASYKSIAAKSVQIKTENHNPNAQEIHQLNKQKEKQATEKRLKHKVRRGENLAGIADKYGVSESDIKEWNPRKIKGSKILAGTVLNIYSDDKQSTQKHVKTKHKKSAKKQEVTPKSYTVKKGDNLQAISKKTGLSVSQLKKHNKNVNNQNLKAGQKLKLKK